MTRKELMLHMLGILLNLAIALETVAETAVDKARASELQAKLDQWIALLMPPRE